MKKKYTLILSLAIALCVLITLLAGCGQVEDTPGGDNIIDGGNDLPDKTPSGGNDSPDKTPSDGKNPSDDTNQGPDVNDPPSDNENDETDENAATFDDSAIGTSLGKAGFVTSGVNVVYNEASQASCAVVKDPRGKGNVLKFVKTNTASGDNVNFSVRDEGSARFVAEFDIAFESVTTTVPLQIDLGKAYRLQIYIDGNYVLVHDAKVNGAETNFLGGYVKIGDFLRVRVEYYYGDGTLDGQFAKVYFDGELFAISQNCYSDTPSTNYDLLKFYSLIASDATMYLDNVAAYRDNVTFVDDGDDTTAYYYADESRDSTYENRFLAAKAILGADVAAALEELCAIFDAGTYTSLANLYDPATGGFYYSNDGRDYAGFLADIESASQAMGLINSMGLGTAQNEYTPEMAAKIVAWVQSLQSNDDGYFYHPQWGDNVNSSRRGRDLGSAIGVLGRFKAAPLYPTALDRLSGSSGASKSLTAPLGRSAVTAVSYVASAATTSVNSHLASPEAFVAYLDELFATKLTPNEKGEQVSNSYVIGHTVSSQASQIQAAGLTDVCINYFNAKQNPENGLWEDEENYRTASGLLKISAFYNSLKAEFPNPDKAVRSAINIAASEEPMTAVVYVYNPLSALSNILSNLKNYNKSEGSNALRLATIEEMQGRALELIENTRAKLITFKKADGSFSYNTYGAPAQSQGADVCFGENEGDVNGTALVNGTIVALFASMGLTKPTYYNNEDKTAFWDIIYNKEPVEKLSVDEVRIDFETVNGATPKFTSTSLSSEGLAEIKEMTVGGKNTKVMRLGSVKGYNDAVKITLPKGKDDSAVRSYVFETDMMLSPKAENAYNSLIQLRLDLAYMLVFEIKNGKIHIYDSTSTGEGNKTSDLGIYVELNEWFNIRVEYYPEDKDTTFACVYINDKPMAVSKNYFGPRIGGNVPEPLSTVSYVNFMTLNGAAVDLYIDNAVLAKSENTVSFPAQVYDFESSSDIPAGVVASGGDAGCSTAVKSDSDGKYLEIVSGKDIGYNVAFGSAYAIGDARAYRFAADIAYTSSNNTTVTQLFMGGTSSTAFALDINYNNGKVTLRERTSGGQGAILISNVNASDRFHLEVIYYPEQGRATVSVMSGGKTTTAETAAYYSDGTKATAFEKARLYSLIGAVYVMEIDNVEVYDILEK